MIVLILFGVSIELDGGSCGDKSFPWCGVGGGDGFVEADCEEEDACLL